MGALARGLASTSYTTTWGTTAETAEVAELRLADFEAEWGKKYPAIGPAWRRVWNEVVPFFAYPPQIRKMIYTTNAIESLHRGLRKIIKTRGAEQALARATIACLTEPAATENFRQRRPQMAIMRRFEQILEANPDEPLYVTDVCAAIGVTDRTLRLHCQDHLGMNPQRYLWLRRMHLARRALALADGAVKTVTEIANDHGFGELGRFAVSYRKLYGEAPSVTLRRPPDSRGSIEIGRANRLISDSA